jgi:hypothetical protein
MEGQDQDRYPDQLRRIGHPTGAIHGYETPASDKEQARREEHYAWGE